MISNLLIQSYLYLSMLSLYITDDNFNCITHWILLIVSFEKRIVHYVDSLNYLLNSSDLALIHHLETCIFFVID
jgi:hypothetical protein